MAMATASNAYTSSFFTPLITGDIDFAYGYVFAGCLLAAVLVVYFFVLEAKRKTLEEMDMMYGMRVSPGAARDLANGDESSKTGQVPAHQAQHIDQDDADVGPIA
ncbi:uncharacterized protein DSM5745_00558 [Aspergillus mulundensis]|uniref:Major facilitator superfamily (MFS) profile domain-containing protein n=1 Tax=Aspergillus mulundensis TaxID=1810919 RepID=A0A3D8T3V8_9EURO|nr:hypothetical protein DSM5745_00558 [Aspergillus mulundensis]RDW93236.1 hypothetical protein DSM5745_00558 [Aspergillus mulundensis]